MATNAKNLAELLNTDSTVAVGDIADGSVTTAKLAADAVTAAKLADDSVVTANIVDGNVTAAKTSGVGGTKNLIINGAMQVAQRYSAGAGEGTVTGLQQGYGGVDRFTFVGNTAARATVSKTNANTTPENGFKSALKIDVTTADTSIASTDYHYLGYRFEGQHLQHIKKGTSSAESLTLSFWVRSPKTGTHIVQLFDNDNTRGISQAYTVSSADTWEKKTITFAGDTTGALDDDNNYSLQIYWWLLAGSDYTTGSLRTSWASWTSNGTAAGQVNVLDNTSNNFYLTGVQMEVGTNATDFEHRPYHEELHSCMRYYINTRSGGSSYGGIQMDRSVYANYAYGYTAFPAEMRNKPSITFYDGSGNSGSLTENGAAHNRGCVANSHSSHGISGAQSNGTGTGHFSSAAGAGYHLQGTYIADAEL